MAKILIPTALRQFTEQQDSVEITGGTVSEALIRGRTNQGVQ